MAEPVIKGWCPGALRPMVSGDGLVVRIRPRGARLGQRQAAEVARLASAYGNGLIDLSSRANIQLRGVTEATYGTLINGLTALGLIDENRAIESRRNIILTPFWAEGDGHTALADALAGAFAAPNAPDLPEKFGFAIDCGSSPVLRDVSADIRLERNADGEMICYADGSAHGARVTADTAINAMQMLADWFLRSHGVRDSRGRMAAHLDRGVVLPDALAQVPVQPCETFRPSPGAVTAGVLVGFDFGQMHAETLLALAELGALRVTPWRMLLIEGIYGFPDLPGIITRPDDPMLRVVACTGSPGCLQAAQPTRLLARTLAPHVPDGSVLHVSGCTKGCAHPGHATLTLTAQTNGFDLIRGGRAQGMPERTALTAGSLAAHPEILSEAH